MTWRYSSSLHSLLAPSWKYTGTRDLLVLPWMGCLSSHLSIISWAPYHLTTDVELESLEGKALSEYFSRGMGMPSDLDLQSIHRVENKSAWQIHKIHRNEVYKQFEQGGHASEGFEMWLWHGSAEIDSIAKQGFHRAFMSLHNNRYGPGFYFAPDPRVSSGGKPSTFLQQSFKWVHDSSIWHMAIPLNCSKRSLNWTCCTVTGFAQNFNRRDPQSDLQNVDNGNGISGERSMSDYVNDTLSMMGMASDQCPFDGS